MIMCSGKLSFQISYFGHSDKSFSPCLHVCLWAFVHGGRKQGTKLRALPFCILLCDLEKTLGLFKAGEPMLPRINMAKSSYRLHNGQATEVNSTALIIAGCVYAYILYVCLLLPAFISNLYKCVYTPECMVGFFFDSFNQRCVVKRHGGSVCLFFLR